MKKLLLLLLLFLSIQLFSQDIVYDSIRGDRLDWRRIKIGSKETIYGVGYANLGIISRSKILLSAGIWSGLTDGIDYKLVDLKNDTLTFEYKSDSNLNLILYKYYYNDTLYNSFFGLRKANLGDELFTGKYLFVCPISQGSTVHVYNGIGRNKKLFMSVSPTIEESLYRDYLVTNKITFVAIKGSKQILIPTVIEFIEDDTKTFDIDIYPNPTSDNINIQIINNTSTILRIFNNKPLLVYQNRLDQDFTSIDLSSLKSGIYLLVFSEPTTESIIHVYKLIKK
jgi:hypothetical protein